MPEPLLAHRFAADALALGQAAGGAVPVALNGSISSSKRQGLDCFRPPREPDARAIRNVGEAVPDLQRLLEDRIGPVDVLQVVSGRRRGEQVRADLWMKMRRHISCGGLSRRGDGRRIRRVGCGWLRNRKRSGQTSCGSALKTRRYGTRHRCVPRLAEEGR
jgi:hypothetical protein